MPDFPAFVINLEHDAVRREHMQRQLSALGIKAEFIPAVNGRALPNADRAAYDKKKALRIYNTEMMDTEIGCYLSHYRLFERIVRENIPAALIMEDDLEIDASLPQVVEKLLADPNPKWLAVRLESMRGRVLNPKNEKDRGTFVSQLGDAALYRLDIHVLGFGGYVITKKGAQQMLDYGRKIFMPIDQTMDRFWENGIVPYIVRPFPIRQRQDFESRIGSRPSGRHLGQPLSVKLWRRWQRLSDGLRKRLFVLTSKG